MPFGYIFSLSVVLIERHYTTVGQRNYFTTSVTVLYEFPLLAVLSITGNNNVIFLNNPNTSSNALYAMHESILMFVIKNVTVVKYGKIS